MKLRGSSTALYAALENSQVQGVGYLEAVLENEGFYIQITM
jgi:hypothetical protein